MAPPTLSGGKWVPRTEGRRQGKQTEDKRLLVGRQQEVEAGGVCGGERESRAYLRLGGGMCLKIILQGVCEGKEARC